MQNILSDLKAKKYHSLYFLHGEEPYFIDVISNYIEDHILDEGEQSFNQSVLYGKETSAQQVVDACMQYPMMASHRVVILKEAQEMKTLNDLEKYISNPSPTTILCVCHKHKKLDSRTKLGKLASQKAVVFESARMYDNQLPAYINAMVKAENRVIDAQSSQMIAEYIGSDLSTLHNEMQKLFLTVEKGSSITKDIIEKQIGISKDFNVFELQSAIAEKNAMKVFRIARYFQENPKKNPMVLVIPTLYKFFTKVWVVAQNSGISDQILGKQIGVFNSFFMKEYRLAARNFPAQKIEHIFTVLQEYDLKAKGVQNRSYQENDLMVEMIAKLMV